MDMIELAMFVTVIANTVTHTISMCIRYYRWREEKEANKIRRKRDLGIDTHAIKDNLKPFIINSLACLIVCDVMLTPIAFLLWSFSIDQYVAWLISGVPINFALGYPIVFIANQLERFWNWLRKSS